LIITAILNGIINIITSLFSTIFSIPVVDGIANVMNPYIVSITNLITEGTKFISFFLPMDLFGVFLPIILALETGIIALDIFKFVIKIIGALK
jgi:hypothetical protein